jgi:hypothetical protein
MRSFYFAHKDVEERIPCKRWDGRNCACGIVRSKESTCYIILYELSQGVAYIGLVFLIVKVSILWPPKGYRCAGVTAHFTVSSL